MTDDLSHVVVVLTIHNVRLSVDKEIELFKRAIAVVDDESPPDLGIILKSRLVFVLTKYICSLATIPEPQLFLCEPDGARFLLATLNVDGICSCRPFVKETDAHLGLLLITVTF